MTASRRAVLPIAAAALVAMLAAAPAIAQPRDQGADAPSAARSTTDRDGRSERRASRAQAVLAAKVAAADAVRIVEAAGYRGIHELEWERGTWEIEAFDAAGARVDLRVDATSGAIVRKSGR
ncbi:PepSY domain-containing protein [Elioraea sp.]|uniref:PepSY domain-containing protein n=1 Tax=Elioraea sp. TaxID=2185103 RepID=UPI0025C193B7|nr:PepSY domain-containing protein [Elioraea sp.]